MRVGQSGGHEELEALAVVDGLLSDCDGVARTGLHHLLKQDWLEGRVQILADALQDHPLAELHCQLDRTHQVGLGGLGNVDALLVLGAEVLDELVGLVLRVDHERPPLGLVDDDSVFGGSVVFGQACDVPRLDDNWHSQEGSHCHVLCIFNTDLLQPPAPRLLHSRSVLSSERARVRNHSCSHCAVTGNQVCVFNHFLHVFRPTHLLV